MIGGTSHTRYRMRISHHLIERIVPITKQQPIEKRPKDIPVDKITIRGEDVTDEYNKP